ncbi:MAG: hypothetical protein P1U68_01375 [Verrucomicrobiales bacterium]|nr:hypothetical protein [Verrucomicrobiales bacterium]
MIGSATETPLSRRSIALIGSLLLLTVVYRVAVSHVDFLGNTAPLMAIAFGGALLLGARFWWIPVVLLVASDLILGVWHGSGGIGRYTLMSAVFYLAVAWLAGRAGRSGKIWPMMWCGTMLCSVLFYVFANTFSWMVFAGYEKSLAGWWQAQTSGVPGINPPAWMFLRNALIADSIWCGIAGLVVLLGRTRSGVESAVAERPA